MEADGAIERPIGCLGGEIRRYPVKLRMRRRRRSGESGTWGNLGVRKGKNPARG